MSTPIEKAKIAVIGAGVVGLSCALRIVEELGQSVEVTVIAESFLNSTTSFHSGGLWKPYAIAGTDESLIRRWGQYSLEYYLSLHRTTPIEAGVQLLTAYQIFSESDLKEGPEVLEPWWKDIVFHFQQLSEDDLRRLNLPNRYIKGFTFGTLVVDMKYYLQFMMSKLSSRGVHFQQRKLDSLLELSDVSYAAVVNCTGLGSSEFANDTKMYPIRGQVVRVRAPWLKSIWNFGTSYIIPNIDNVVLGGTTDVGEWDTTPSLATSDDIVRNACEVFPALRHASLESVWVGLRPGRSPLRLEAEKVALSAINREILLIHCYGHGGSGVTLAVGCANDVVMLHLIPYLRRQ